MRILTLTESIDYEREVLQKAVVLVYRISIVDRPGIAAFSGELVLVGWSHTSLGNWGQTCRSGISEQLPKTSR